MKEKIEQMYIQALIDDLPPNVFADQVFSLFYVSGLLPSDWEITKKDIMDIHLSPDSAFGLGIEAVFRMIEEKYNRWNDR